MTNNLKFSHKILLAASLVVIAAFSLFTLYNDYLQRNGLVVHAVGQLENVAGGREAVGGGLQEELPPELRFLR